MPSEPPINLSLNNAPSGIDRLLNFGSETDRQNVAIVSRTWFLFGYLSVWWMVRAEFQLSVGS